MRTLDSSIYLPGYECVIFIVSDENLSYWLYWLTTQTTVCLFTYQTIQREN